MSTFMLIMFGVLCLAGLIGSAFYSGMETGLYTINRVRLKVRSGQGDSRAQWLHKLIRQPATMLTVLLLGNNIANYVSSFGIAGLLDAAGISPIEAIVINAGVLIPLLFVFGEVLPKDLFRTQTDRWSYSCTGGLRWTARILTVIGLLPIISAGVRIAGGGARNTSLTTPRQRLGQLFKEGMGAGVLSESQSALLDRALTMRNLAVTGEMVPWSQVRSLNADLTGTVRLDAIRGHQFTQLPVVEQDGTVVGVLSVLDILLEPDQSTRTLLQPIVQLEGSTSIPVAMEYLREKQRSMAIVVDAQNQPLGIVTIKDLAEALTGDLA